MRYQGSKARLFKKLSTIVCRNLTPNKIFIDMFGGGMNFVDKVDCKQKIANDFNSYVVELWKDIQENGMKNIPYNVSEADYYDAKKAYLCNDYSRYSKAQIAYIAVCCSYSGKWWGGYAHYNEKRNEDHVKEAYYNLKRQVEGFVNLRNTMFVNSSYSDWGFDSSSRYLLPSPEDCVIYCDPPYMNTVKYKDDFDSEAFWKWVRKLSKYGYEIYVSEYNAPKDFTCLTEIVVADGMQTTKSGIKQNRKVEKLFRYQ